MTDNELQKSHWRHVTGVVTPGGDPYYECPSCGWGRCYGIEHREEMPDVCPNCGMRMKAMTPFEFARSRITQIADNLLAVDGNYPTWDYADLMTLIDSIEREYEDDKGYR